MSNIVSNNYTPFQVFPKYVVDETLQKVVTSNENGDPALRVVCNDVEPDLTEIESRIGEKTEGEWDNSVDTNPGSIISILKNIDNKLTTPIRPPTPPPEMLVLKHIYNVFDGSELLKTDFTVTPADGTPISVAARSTVYCIGTFENNSTFTVEIYVNAMNGPRTFYSLANDILYLYDIPSSSGTFGLGLGWSDSYDPKYTTEIRTPYATSVVVEFGNNNLYDVKTFFS